jgi:hypothetical protein
VKTKLEKYMSRELGMDPWAGIRSMLLAYAKNGKWGVWRMRLRIALWVLPK